MFRAMALKELREIRIVVVGAMIIYGLITIAAIDPNSPLNLFHYLSGSMYTYSIPFVRDAFVGKFYFFSGLMAITFGLWQTFGESLRGTYPFLLHRPASRRQLIGMKLLVGAAVYLIVTAVPLVIYSIWAATPGNHASPFEWSMTVSSWVTWSAMSMLYLGAFLTGIRPGRWYRSRFLPLAAAAFALIAVAAFSNTMFDGTWWLCWIVLVVDIWIISTILFVAKIRDYS